MKGQQKVLTEPDEWLKALAITLDIQSAAGHSASGRSTPWWTVQPALGVSKPKFSVFNPC